MRNQADPDDANKDGISGRMRIVTDYDNALPHLGRFGWKAGKPSVRDQVAGAFNTDMGVTSSVPPNPDCGSVQTNCGTKGPEVDDSGLALLVDYISLLGVSTRKDIMDPVNLKGEALFAGAGCAACHVPTLVTGAGRARTLQEAILWHGGEGQAAADKFKAMSQTDADARVKFLKSL